MTCYRKGGCGPYEMYSCSECPASNPSFLTKHIGCPLCNMKPIFDEDGEWSMFDSSKLLESGPYETISACMDKDGRLALYGAGDDITGLYYPHYCPECGRWIGARTEEKND